MIDLETITVFAARRGFVYPSSQLYGGFGGVYDYGPIGVALANNIKAHWWHAMVQQQQNIVGLDSGIFLHPKVWEASGHTGHFREAFVMNTKTGRRYRLDHLLETIDVEVSESASLDELQKTFAKHREKLEIPDGVFGDLGEPQFENLLVESNFGGTSNSSPVYLRGETCQGIYINFKNVVDTMHPSLPFGIAQIGKAFRNEISPRQFLFRTREFEQMEMQFFFQEEERKQWFTHFQALRLNSLYDLGIPEESLRVKPHKQLVFYAKEAVDIEYQYPFGWQELEGIHDRGDYDLQQHMKASGEKLTYFNQEKNQHITPHIIETSIGVGRLFLAVLHSAYTTETLPDGSERVVLRLKPTIAPIQIAVLPLMKKPELQQKAQEVYELLCGLTTVMYDETQAIGKRYRRQDEIGTPYCITIDFETLDDLKVTVRDRDSMEQKRIPIASLADCVTSGFRFVE